MFKTKTRFIQGREKRYLFLKINSEERHWLCKINVNESSNFSNLANNNNIFLKQKPLQINRCNFLREQTKVKNSVSTILSWFNQFKLIEDTNRLGVGLVCVLLEWTELIMTHLSGNQWCMGTNVKLQSYEGLCVCSNCPLTDHQYWRGKHLSIGLQNILDLRFERWDVFGTEWVRNILWAKI